MQQNAPSAALYQAGQQGSHPEQQKAWRVQKQLPATFSQALQ
jgi:hypothetical protein